MSIDISTYLSIFKLEARGQLHAARGDEEAARADFDSAIAFFEDLGSRIELAWALVLRDDDEDPVRARELFQACGATGKFSSR